MSRFISSDELLITGKLLGLPKQRCWHRYQRYAGPDCCGLDKGKTCLEEDRQGQCTIHIEDEIRELEEAKYGKTSTESVCSTVRVQ